MLHHAAIRTTRGLAAVLILVATITCESPTAVTSVPSEALASLSRQAPISVEKTQVASIRVTLASPRLVVRQMTMATATLRDASGNILTGRSVSWSSSDDAVASVSASGRVTGQS